MRLVVTGTPPDVWVWLDPHTAEEMVALEACAARGEWTNRRGVLAIETLRALAARLGYPVEAPDRWVTPSPLPRLAVVQRGEPALYARLRAMAWEGVTVIMDRRQGERRTTDRPAAVDRRRRDRRRPPPATWGTLRFLVVPTRSAPP